ncbi:hypothetical protein K439DRAFT_1271545, partial [Ramaria rubella]
ICNVMKDTVILSWINSVPPNFGDATAGMLKADKWCTLSTIYLPLTLISLWGAGTIHPNPSNHKFRELETTMLQAFIRGAKLYHWLIRPDCPPAIKECLKLFEKAYSSKG